MKFVGVDLAWSERNASGLAVLSGNKEKAELILAKIGTSDQEILDFIKEGTKEDKAFISIDAPLIVPNKTGRRVAEEITGKLFRKFNAGAHPANRTRLSSFTGSIRGEVISKKLEKQGYEHNPKTKKFENSNKFFEVYPHPSIVVLFKLDKILQYKAKPKRDYNFRYKEFKKYQSYLKGLEKAETKLVLPKKITNLDVTKLRGKKLKNYEDLLDGVFCAYLSYYIWKNPEKCAILGNFKKGYILTPIFEYQKELLK
ncbi:MAG: DUF429 domain-containing protein [Candidatus Nanoarchaeia archaeon]|nr:DUF429 domain-containing protein [Candidatus Nanoarchaeia archaeon]MDD5587848.1 DUF429 domain-containing protein [Candidatus Nanoarchaeia archaeon]